MQVMRPELSPTQCAICFVETSVTLVFLPAPSDRQYLLCICSLNRSGGILWCRCLREALTTAFQKMHGSVWCCYLLLRFLVNTCLEDTRFSRYTDSSTVILAGHSRGGKLSALAAAVDPRVSGLLLLDPVDNTSMTPSGGWWEEDLHRQHQADKGQLQETDTQDD